MAGLLAFIPFLEGVLNRVIPDPAERMKMQIELAKLADAEAARESSERIAQTEVNKVEASNSSLFVAGWRPAVGWACVAGFVYTTIVAPLTGAGVADVAFLRDVLLGMLGINVAARSIEKIKGVAQNSLTGGAVVGKANEPVAQLPEKEKKKVLGVEWPF